MGALALKPRALALKPSALAPKSSARTPKGNHLSDICAVFCHMVRRYRGKIATFERYRSGPYVAL